MDIIANGRTLSIPSECTVTMLLQLLGYSDHVAVFINGNQLLMSEYESYKLKNQDSVKIIRPLSGG